jgi:bifunctional N-acetylglucosamine-1-phosphate-uridyltransferase/glucosamine-1-phosphate-acetyltransferase GlmU-like protein
VERKDATAEELEIKEVNPAFFTFDAAWLWKNLEALRNQNAQGEYYLTDLVKVAFEQQFKIASIETHPRAAIGINTPTELKVAEELVD